MSVLLVLVAHDGKTLQLDVSPQTRIDAVQQALVSVTGISVSDQIVMCQGARLDPAKPLAAYRLPVANPSAAEDHPVFLYHKTYLRPGAAPPAAEPLPMLEVVVPGLPSVGLRHPLQSAHSPLIRALPDYEAQFQQQLGEARAYWEASQQRLHRCRQLMSEQEVQARAADAARANVESHYNYIAASYAAFVDKYVAQYRHHGNLLTQFAGLSAALQSIELPPQLATPTWRVLADLQPRSKLAEWHDSCSRSHEQFAQKVSELEGVFQLLRCDVERLFLQAPSVDLDMLGTQLGEAETLIDEQGSTVQVLSKDLLTVRQLVEDVVAQLGGSAGGASLSGAAVHDTCAAVDTMHDNHLHSLLPRVRACDSAVVEFLLRCSDAKTRMTADVLEQLQGIAAQQSRIRDMKHKLAVFNEVLTRQAAAFAELQTATRLPAAYRLALAECARRAAWQEMFASQASRLAEHCGRITGKEAAKRDSVRRQLERHLPTELLAKAGLLAEPPHCMVSVPPTDIFLLPVSPADLARLPAAIQQAADAAAAAEQQTQQVQRSASQLHHQEAASAAKAEHGSEASAAPGASEASAGPGVPLTRVNSPRFAFSGAAGGGAASTMVASAWLSRPDGPSGAGPGGTLDLALENARLRAELASLLAQAAAKELAGIDHQGSASSSVAAAADLVKRSMHASILMAASQAAPTSSGQPLHPVVPGDASISLAASSHQQQADDAAPVVADVVTGAGAGTGGPAARPYGHGGPAVVPASVAASLPQLSALLQQTAAADAEAAATAAAKQALSLAPVQAALSAKDDLIASLEATCKSLTANISSYEKRIIELESQVAARFSSSGGIDAGTAAQQHPPQEPGVVPSSTAVGSSHGVDRQHAMEAVGGDHQQLLVEQSVTPVFALKALPAESLLVTVTPDDASASNGSKQATVTATDLSEVAVAAASLTLPGCTDAAGSPAVTMAQPAGPIHDSGEAGGVEDTTSSLPSSDNVADHPRFTSGAFPARGNDDPQLDIQTTPSKGTSDDVQLQQQLQEQPQQGDHVEQQQQELCQQHLPGDRSQEVLGQQQVLAGDGAGPIEDSGDEDVKCLGQQQQQEEERPPSVAASVAEKPPVAGDAAADPATAALPRTCSTASAPTGLTAGPPAALSVSEPDLRGVMVASPADVEAHRQQHQQQPGRVESRSLDGSGPHLAGGSNLGVGAGSSGGISSLLTSSMQFLFHRTGSSAGGSSRGESTGGSAAGGSNASAASPAVSPPMSPPAAAADGSKLRQMPQHQQQQQ